MFLFVMLWQAIVNVTTLFAGRMAHLKGLFITYFPTRSLCIIIFCLYKEGILLVSIPQIEK